MSDCSDDKRDSHDRKKKRESRKHIRCDKSRSRSRSKSHSRSRSPHKIDCQRVKLRILKGSKGDTGCEGRRGRAGKRGEKGRCGDHGKDGQDGRDGKDGQDGRNGKKGQRGKKGRDGHDGCDGHDGRHGKDLVRAFAFAVNDVSTATPLATGDRVVFNNSGFHDHDVAVLNSSITFERGGTYFVDYLVVGQVPTGSAQSVFALQTLDNVSLEGTVALSDLPDTLLNVRVSASVQITLPHDSCNVVIGLVNVGTSTVSIGNALGAANATIRVQRIA